MQSFEVIFKDKQYVKFPEIIDNIFKDWYNCFAIYTLCVNGVFPVFYKTKGTVYYSLVPEYMLNELEAHGILIIDSKDWYISYITQLNTKAI